MTSITVPDFAPCQVEEGCRPPMPADAADSQAAGQLRRCTGYFEEPRYAAARCLPSFDAAFAAAFSQRWPRCQPPPQIFEVYRP